VSGQGRADSPPPRVLVLSPPAPEWLGPIRALYSLWDHSHARGEWAADLERRLLGRAGAGSLDRFYLVTHGEQVAAALDVSRSADFGGLAIVHRVFTHPAARRKGLARSLLEAAKRDFLDACGRLLIVAAPGTGPAREFYSAQGFSEIVRAADGTSLLGWAARGRQVREALLRFLRQEPVSFRAARSGDWAALVAWSSLPGGRPDYSPPTILDSEWIGVLGGAGIEVGESRHGYIVAARPCAQGGTAAPRRPEWLERLLAAAR